MPPRKRGPAATSKAKPNFSALAKQHGLPTAQVASIHESFGLFAVHHPSYPSESSGVLKREDVRRCLIALGVTPSAEDLPGILESLDPEGEGFVTFEPFLEVAGLYLSEQAGGDDADEDEELSSPPEDLDDFDDEPPTRGKTKRKQPATEAKGKGARKGKAKVVVATSREEINDAFRLFTKGGTGPITLQHLRRIAHELREEVSDDMLRDMILEANGEGVAEGGGKDGWRKGVAIEDFEGVMRRAGVFG